MSELLDLTAAQAGERVRAGELSAGELFDLYRGRAEADELGCFLWVAPDAPAQDPAAPLGGVPLAVKDLFCVQGVPSMAGSRILEGYRPPYTATVVRRLMAAGAPVLGKTNMDEFAMGSSNENSGFGPVSNPWDRTRVPGGSSGGSAASVAAGSAPWAIGTDTGGSIRQPAALCGIVGLKPTYGAVSRYGMIAFASSLDQCGPLTRDVTDAALLFRHMVGERDCCDSTSLDYPAEVALPSAQRLDGLRFGVWGLAEEGVEAGVAEVTRRSLAKIEELGGAVEEIELPHAGYGISAYYVLAPAEASSNLARYDGVRFGIRRGNGDLLSLYETTRAEGFGAEVKRRIMLGTYALSSGYYDAYYGTAQRVRTKIADDFRAAFEKVDFVVTPTSPTVAFKLGERTENPLAMYLSDYFTVPMSLAGIPAISIPAGLSDGLPVGLQIAGPAFSESRILDASYALEAALGFDGVLPVADAYEPVIGLEIHCQLSTRTKMFCGCALSFGDEPNTHTCPICLGHPGTLPVTNAEAVHFGLMIGLALECEIAPRSIFHRKNYFYPDLPKGYQISQYDIPLASTGRLGDVRIHRVHLEEDAAKLVHAGSSGRIHGSEASVVDFNRGGTPLVEIVTEPDLRSGEEAADWGRLLRATLRRLGVSDVNMEEGSLRVDANVSIRPVGSDSLGTKAELKNMNSFRFLRQGIEAEIERQKGIVATGGTVEQETLHFDPQSGSLSPLRSKEYAHDYRYFPEPDLTPLVPTEAMLERARAALPELPSARAMRFEQELGLPEETARVLAFRGELGDYYETALATDSADAKTLANWVRNELVQRLGETDPAESNVSPEALAQLVAMVDARTVSQSAAKQVLEVLVEKGGDPAQIVEEQGLAMQGGDELESIVERAIAADPDAVEQIRAGNQKAVGALMGAIMRETRGRADGKEVQRLIRERIGA